MPHYQEGNRQPAGRMAASESRDPASGGESRSRATGEQMTGKPEAVQKHVAGWHEADPVLRRAAISELWSDQAVYRNSGTEFRRHEGIANAVTEAYEAFIRKATSSRWSKSAPTMRPSGTHGKRLPAGAARSRRSAPVSLNPTRRPDGSGPPIRGPAYEAVAGDVPLPPSAWQ